MNKEEFKNSPLFSGVLERLDNEYSWYIAARERDGAEAEKKHRIEMYNYDRSIDIRNIIVTLQSGVRLDGDENSQVRLLRASSSMNDTETIRWTDADNQVQELTKAELQEGLRLAGEAQTAIWAKYAAMKAAL